MCIVCGLCNQNVIQTAAKNIVSANLNRMNAMAGGLGEAMWQIPKGEAEFESVSESVSATSTSNAPRTSLNWELRRKTTANTTGLRENLRRTLRRVETRTIGLTADLDKFETRRL
jgi:hypothetical protein